MKRKLIIFTMFTLIFLEIVSVSLTYKSFNNKDVVYSTISINKDKQLYSIKYQTEKNGAYVDYTGDKWPDSNTYGLNSTKTTCVDENGSEVKVLDFINGVAKVTTTKNVYCNLYFDIWPNDKRPEIDVFKITDKTTYSITVHIEAHDDKGISKYCFSLSSSSRGTCFDSSSLSISNDYTFNNLKPNTNYSLYATVVDTIGQTDEDSLPAISTANLNCRFYPHYVNNGRYSVAYLALDVKGASTYTVKDKNSNSVTGTKDGDVVQFDYNFHAEATYTATVKDVKGNTVNCSIKITTQPTKTYYDLVEYKGGGVSGDPDTNRTEKKVYASFDTLAECEKAKTDGTYSGSYTNPDGSSVGYGGGISCEKSEPRLADCPNNSPINNYCYTAETNN